MARNNAIFCIAREGRITKEIKEKFFDGYGFTGIRDWLEDHGFDRHMTIELTSVEIAIMTPEGILMQIRKDDRDQLGFWGGVIEDGESPLEAAIRELREETGLIVTPDELKVVGSYAHEHTYANGDQAAFMTYRFRLDRQITHNDLKIDPESSGYMWVRHTILAEHQKFVKKLLGELSD